MVTMNKDIAINRKHFVNDSIFVTSIFRTIQGEGPLAGYPAVFLRLAGCNFGDKEDHCSWCDTSFKIEEAEEFSVEDLANALTSLDGYRPTDVLVVTGGEPMLQINLLKLLEAVESKFHKLQIETNGTQAYFCNLLASSEIDVMVVVSPKASVKLGGYAPLSETIKAVASCLKFVVTAEEGYHHTVPDWAISQGLPIYVSPMAVYKKAYSGEVSSIWDHDLIDVEATKANYAYAAKYAMDHGFLLSLQTHLFTAVP